MGCLELVLRSLWLPPHIFHFLWQNSWSCSFHLSYLGLELLLHSHGLGDFLFLLLLGHAFRSIVVLQHFLLSKQSSLEFQQSPSMTAIMLSANCYALLFTFATFASMLWQLSVFTVLLYSRKAFKLSSFFLVHQKLLYSKVCDNIYWHISTFR